MPKYELKTENFADDIIRLARKLGRLASGAGGAGGTFEPGPSLPGAPLLQDFGYANPAPGTYMITATIAGGGQVFGSPLALRVVERKPPAPPRPPDPMPIRAVNALLSLRERFASFERA